MDEQLEKTYKNNWRVFEGRLLTEDSIDKFPDCIEKDHIKLVRDMLENEGYAPDEFRVAELPIQDVYYFERALSSEPGVDYFGVEELEDGQIKPLYTTNTVDKNGCNTFNCSTIKESIERHSQAYCERCEKLSMKKTQEHDENNTCAIWECIVCDNREERTD